MTIMNTLSNSTTSELGRMIRPDAIDQFVKKSVFYNGEMVEKATLPQGMHFYAWPIMNRMTFNTGEIELVEGITPTPDQESFTQVDFYTQQYGRWLVLTDLLLQDSPIPVFTKWTKELYRQMAQDIDTIVQNTLLTGVNVVYPASRTSRGAITSTDIAKSTYFAIAQAQLQALAAPGVDDEDSYVAVIHPYVKYDLLTDPTVGQYLDAAKYHQPEKLFRGEFGQMFGVRFIVSSNMQILAGQGSAGANVFPSFMFGKDAYGIVESMPFQTIIKPLGSSGTADPGNQRASIFVKVRFAVNLLKQESLQRIETSSSIQTLPIY